MLMGAIVATSTKESVSFMNYDEYSTLGGVLAVYFLVSSLLGIVFYVVASLFLMKIFEKAGVVGKWRAWVPVYNMMIFFKLGDLSPWLVLYGLGGMLLLSWAGIGALFSLALGVLSAMAAWRIGLKLQKEAVWVVLYVFLALVWLGIAAFDKSRWNPNIVPASWANNGFFGDRTVWDGVPAQTTTVAAAPQGYVPPQAPAAPPATPQAPAAPAQGAPVPPAPAAPPAAPPAPPAPPAAPSAAPPAPPTPPADPEQPQA